MQKIPVLLITILSTSLAHAQFSWGVNTGVQYSNVHVADNGNLGTSKYSYLVPGFHFQYNFRGHSTVSAGIQFSNKGYKQNVTLSPGQIMDVRYCLPYLTFPLLYHYRFQQGTALFAGIEPG